MKTRSKKTSSNSAETGEGMERSRRLRQTEPAKAPRASKKRSAQSAEQPGAPETAKPVHEVVRFQFIAPSAREVCLAGTFNDWKYGATPMIRADDGQWVIELNLHPGVYEYRFVVDGVWKLDPNNMECVPNPFGESNSVLIIGPIAHPAEKPST